MKIRNFHLIPNKEKLLDEIEDTPWAVSKLLAKLIRENSFYKALGDDAELYIVTDNDSLVAFATLTQRDCIPDDSLFPWIGFVYVCPVYRGHRYSGLLIDALCNKAKSCNYKRVYLATDHTGLYEKYGFRYMENRIDVWGEDSRIYYKEI